MTKLPAGLYVQQRDLTGEWLALNAVFAPVTVPFPGTPTDLVATANGDHILLTWSSALNAATYRVKRAMVTGGPYDLLAFDLRSVYYRDTTALVGCAYFYVVSAVNAAGESAESEEATAQLRSAGQLVDDEGNYIVDDEGNIIIL